MLKMAGECNAEMREQKQAQQEEVDRDTSPGGSARYYHWVRLMGCQPWPEIICDDNKGETFEEDTVIGTYSRQIRT